MKGDGFGVLGTLAASYQGIDRRFAKSVELHSVRWKAIVFRPAGLKWF